MSRWIEEKWLNKRIKDSYRERIGLDSAPSIDIVRCSECKYKNDCEQEVLLSEMYGEIEDTAHITYCSYGEREGE